VPRWQSTWQSHDSLFAGVKTEALSKGWKFAVSKQRYSAKAEYLPSAKTKALGKYTGFAECKGLGTWQRRFPDSTENVFCRVL
jgi:hypothetical protein